MKSSEIPAGAVLKTMTSKQLKMMDGDKIAAYLTNSARMATIDYSCCDSIVTDNEVHHNVNLLHAHEVEYLVNLSKQDSVIGGKHLSLADGRANGLIIGLDMLILYFNSMENALVLELQEITS